MRGDIHLDELSVVRFEDGSHRFERNDALIDLLSMSEVSLLEIGEARLALLVLGIQPAVYLIEHEVEVRIHGTAGMLEACEVLMG